MRAVRMARVAPLTPEGYPAVLAGAGRVPGSPGQRLYEVRREVAVRVHEAAVGHPYPVAL